MSRFHLIGSYTGTTIQHFVSEDVERVIIPLANSNGTLKHGIENALCKIVQQGIDPTEDGIDLLRFAALVYLADTRISRILHSQDSWTREITIELPVTDSEKWKAAGQVFERMLDFLTGDRWTILFTQKEYETQGRIKLQDREQHFNAFTLFSGGMDSLIGSINHLEQKKNVMLISHAGDGVTKNSQSLLLHSLNEVYAANPPFYLDLWMKFEDGFIPNGGTENTTRSRSFLFIALGVFSASGADGVSLVEVPENGLIALNIPLDPLRIGSHSTRTTHPFYLNLWNTILETLGIEVRINNPYWDKTKGEMAVECLNKELLLSIIGDSASCSSPSKGRWRGLPPQHCGYCVPCIIRRAAINKAFSVQTDPTPYTYPQVGELISEPAGSIGNQLRSFQVAIQRIRSTPELAKILVYKAGPIIGTEEYKNRLAAIYTRGLIEVDEFISSKWKESV